MILLPHDTLPVSSVGTKARTLADLHQTGYPVPDFVVVPTCEVQKVLDHPEQASEQLDLLTVEIKKHLPTSRFAVRSAALIEDGVAASHAGQFHTMLAVTDAQLSKALLEVSQKSAAKLADSGGLSLIVQTYIAPEYAGVLFTRNPLGDRTTVVEYVAGVGESAVGGEGVERLEFLSHQASQQGGILQALTKLVHVAQRIEERYGWPQDIEWAMCADELYILQSRPITTLSCGQWEGFRLLESELKNDSSYWYEQTTTSETFIQPRPLAYSLLEYVYRSAGAIDRAYGQLGVRYTSTPQFRLFGNQLFVDKEAELRSLMPAYSCLAKQSAQPKRESFVGLGLSIRNIAALQFCSTASLSKLRAQIQSILSKKPRSFLELSSAIQELDAGYELIFEGNIRAQKAVTQLERVLGRDSYRSSGLLSLQLAGVISATDLEVSTENMIGNSLSLDDESPFVRNTTQANAPDEEAFRWWGQQPQWKKRGLETHIVRAQEAVQLREEARWLTVRLVSQLRSAVELRGKDVVPLDPELIHFATVAELIEGSVLPEAWGERRNTYAAQTSYEFPQRIASFLSTKKKSSVSGLAAGVAEGVVCTPETVASVHAPKILYTNTLSPELSQYLDKIVGIITHQGGLLSHMAIVAREAGVPVVQTTDPIELGVHIRIDGSAGKAEILKSN